MKIAILKETKNKEGRVALTPFFVNKLVQKGHHVFVQKDAGTIAGFSNADFKKAGAIIVHSTKTIIERSELILKVKEPSLTELDYIKPHQILFCFLHLAAFPVILKKILAKKITALGYETLQLKNGSLPLLYPMSEIAGKLATQYGAYFLRADQGGRGVLLGGTEKVAPANVLVLGGGRVGESAVKVAVGLGARVAVVDISSKKLKYLKRKYGEKIQTYLSNKKNIQKLALKADLLIGAVLITGDKAPKLVTESLVKKMNKGAVIVDVAVDQGGCIETTEVTSHEKPIKVKYGILHYAVPNIPGSVPVTGTLALSRETFPYILKIANLGLAKACEKYPEIKLAINCQEGVVVHRGLKNQ